jgi:hypothetical protein
MRKSQLMKPFTTFLLLVVLSCATRLTVCASTGDKTGDDKPERLFIEHYRETIQWDYDGRSDYYYDDGRHSWSHGVFHINKRIAWLDGIAGGSSLSVVEHAESDDGPTYDANCATSIHWPGAEQGNAWQIVAGTCNPANTGPEQVNAQAFVLKEHCDVVDPDYKTWSGYNPHLAALGVNSKYHDYQRHAQARMTLWTGGKSIPGRKCVVRFTGSAQRILNLRTGSIWDYWDERTNILSQNINIGSLGALDTNGTLVVVMESGSTADVTPEVPGESFYTFDLSHGKAEMELRNVSFNSMNMVHDSGVPYPIPQWWRNVPGSTNSPVLFKSGTRIQPTVVLDAPNSALTMDVVVKGVAGNGYTFLLTNSWGIGSSGSWEMTVPTASLLPSNTVDQFQLNIEWSCAIPALGIDFMVLGTSANQAYVSWHQPTTGNLYHTVVDVACRNAIGQTVESNIVAGIWSDFTTDRSVLKADGTGPMKYWGPVAVAHIGNSPLDTTAELVKESDGQCGAWAAFLKDVFGTHGINCTPHKISPPLGGFAVYQTLPGQGGVPGKYAFEDHDMVSLGLVLYDPSYGKDYPSHLAWEDASADFYGYPNSINDVKGVVETGIAPPFSP